MAPRRPRDPDWPALSRIWLVRERAAIDGKQALTPRLVDELAPFGSPVLVVGGGAGLIPVHLARAGHDVTAIDACAEMNELVRARAAQAEVQLRIVHARADVAPVTERFATVIVSTGVVTPATLRAPETEALLERAHEWVAPGGVLVLACCTETDDNLPYRTLYSDLGLDLPVSNNRLFVGMESLAAVRARFLDVVEPDLVERWFDAEPRLVAAQHRMVRAFEAELIRQSVDPEGFVAAYLGYQKPFLTRDEEDDLARRIGLRFPHVERRVLGDGETSVLVARS